jgi:hypothetical protein
LRSARYHPGADVAKDTVLCGLFTSRPRQSGNLVNLAFSYLTVGKMLIYSIHATGNSTVVRQQPADLHLTQAQIDLMGPVQPQHKETKTAAPDTSPWPW